MREMIIDASNQEGVRERLIEYIKKCRWHLSVEGSVSPNINGFDLVVRIPFTQKTTDRIFDEIIGKGKPSLVEQARKLIISTPKDYQEKFIQLFEAIEKRLEALEK